MIFKTVAYQIRSMTNFIQVGSYNLFVLFVKWIVAPVVCFVKVSMLIILDVSEVDLFDCRIYLTVNYPIEGSSLRHITSTKKKYFAQVSDCVSVQFTACIIMCLITLSRWCLIRLSALYKAVTDKICDGYNIHCLGLRRIFTGFYVVDITLWSGSCVELYFIHVVIRRCEFMCVWCLCLHVTV